MTNTEIIERTIKEIENMRVSKSDIEIPIFKMFEIGLITIQRAKRFLVKKAYFDKMNDQRMLGRTSAIETALEFDVSTSFVNKCVYHYTDIKVF